MATNPSMQSESAAMAEKKKKSAAVGRAVDVEATDEQARAIIATAKRAVVEEAKTQKTRADSGAGKPSASVASLKRSLECFLQGRKNKNNSPPPSSAAQLAVAISIRTSTASSSSSSSSN